MSDVMVGKKVPPVATHYFRPGGRRPGDNVSSRGKFLLLSPLWRTVVTAAQHEAAMKKGAKEIKPGAVIYKQGGKLYMLEEPQNETFRDVFENF